jgi:tRNA A-37 threonylcarbamoyl transferase component Bud32
MVLVSSLSLMQEYCNGGSLASAISTGLFDPDSIHSHWQRLILILQDVAEGMAYIHSMKICHGDLNPSNVLLKVRFYFLPFLYRPCFTCTHFVDYCSTLLLDVHVCLHLATVHLSYHEERSHALQFAKIRIHTLQESELTTI